MGEVNSTIGLLALNLEPSDQPHCLKMAIQDSFIVQIARFTDIEFGNQTGAARTVPSQLHFCIGEIERAQGCLERLAQF